MLIKGVAFLGERRQGTEEVYFDKVIGGAVLLLIIVSI